MRKESTQENTTISLFRPLCPTKTLLFFISSQFCQDQWRCYLRQRFEYESNPFKNPIVEQKAYENERSSSKVRFSRDWEDFKMKQSHPVEEFHFPMEMLNYRSIRNCEHFYDKIKKDNLPLRRDVGFQPTLITDSEGVETLTIQCKQCESYFKYVRARKGEYYSLREYNQKHQHVLRQVHTSHQSIIQRIEKFLQQDDARMEKHQLEADICINYRISSTEFEQLYSQAAERLKRNTLLYDGKQIDQLVKKLKSERFNIQVDHLTSKIDREPRTITKSVLITNDQMTVNYRKYNESCFLAIDDHRQINRWHVGGIIGIGRNMEMSLFALFLMKSVDEDHLRGVLKLFFTVNEAKPQTFVTQTDYLYEKTLLDLKKEGFLLSEHVFDFATNSQKMQRNNPKFRKIFADLAKEPQKWKFFNKLNQLYNSQNFHQLDLDLEELVSQSDQVCLSQIKAVPVGPYRSIRNKAQKKTDYSPIRMFLKTLYERECQVGKHLYSKVKNMLALLLGPQDDDCAESNRVMKDIYPKLHEFREQVTLSVMDNLIRKVYSTVQLRSKMIDDCSYQVFEDRQHYCLVTKKNEKWVCQCEQSIKTMLPCVHELLICCKTGSAFDVQVGKRWTNQDQRLEQEMRRRMFRKPRNKNKTLTQFLA